MLHENTLTYQDCTDIYNSWALGKRFVNALVNYAMSSGRVIRVGDAPPEVSKKFNDTAKRYSIDNKVKNALKVARIYGLSGIYIASDSDSYENLTTKDLTNSNIAFNVLYPLSIAGLAFNQDPLSINYQKPTYLQINNRKVGDRRFIITLNDMPLLYDFENTNFNFAGKSIFKNMGELIALWNNLYDSLEKIAIKASAIVVIGDAQSDSIFGGFKKSVIEKSAEIIKQMKQGQVVWLKSGSLVEFFNLNGVTEIANMIENVRDAFTMALSDTPISILMDKKMSSGLNEGEADFESAMMSIKSFRDEKATPLYIYLDSFIRKLAWSDNFIHDIKLKYPELYAEKSNNEIFNEWESNFSFEWDRLSQPSAKEINDEKSGFLDNMLKLRDLGVQSQNIIDEINESKYFSKSFTLRDYDGLNDNLSMDITEDRE